MWLLLIRLGQPGEEQNERLTREGGIEFPRLGGMAQSGVQLTGFSIERCEGTLVLRATRHEARGSPDFNLAKVTDIHSDWRNKITNGWCHWKEIAIATEPCNRLTIVCFQGAKFLMSLDCYDTPIDFETATRAGTALSYARPV
jgi:hypothetical protein